MHRHQPLKLIGGMAKEAVRHSTHSPPSGRDWGRAAPQLFPHHRKGATAGHEGRTAFLSARSPILGKALLLVKEAARYSVCVPLS